MKKIKRIDNKGNIGYLKEITIATRVFVTDIMKSSVYHEKDAEKLVKWFEREQPEYRYSII